MLSSVDFWASLGDSSSSLVTSSFEPVSDSLESTGGFGCAFVFALFGRLLRFFGRFFLLRLLFFQLLSYKFNQSHICCIPKARQSKFVDTGVTTVSTGELIDQFIKKFGYGFFYREALRWLICDNESFLEISSLL